MEMNVMVEYHRFFGGIMSDWVDDAQRLIEWRIQSSLSQLTKVITYGHGRCYYCLAWLPVEQRFCDSDCRDDHERIQRLTAIKFGKNGLHFINTELDEG